MSDLPVHLLLFSIAGVAIVVVSSFFSEEDDTVALRSIPRRLGYFFVGCTLVAVVMLVLEHTLARVG